MTGCGNILVWELQVLKCFRMKYKEGKKYIGKEVWMSLEGLKNLFLVHNSNGPSRPRSSVHPTQEQARKVLHFCACSVGSEFDSVCPWTLENMPLTCLTGSLTGGIMEGESQIVL